MGCLLGCFGGTKEDRKQRCKQRNKVLPRDTKHSHGCSFSHQNDALSEQKPHRCSVSRPIDALSEHKPIESSPITLVELQVDKPEEKSSSGSGSKKRVTFNSNVKTYEHVSPLYESRDSLPEAFRSLTDEEIEQISAKVKQSLSSSEESSIGSNSGSFPPNYRYQNCRDSDDEIEECCDDDSDLDDDDHGDDYEEEGDYFDDDIDGNGDHLAFEGQEDWSELLLLPGSMESKTEKLSAQPTNEEVENGAEMFKGTDKDTGYVSAKSASVLTVLNPVENLTRWKSVNTKCESEQSTQKENISLASETDTCSSFEPVAKRASSNLKPRYHKPINEEVAVDASLSTWLSSSSKANGRESVCSENSSKSQSSKYTRNNLEDRPILGALTVEELKEISKYSSSSPRKSPSRSPDETPIIGSVGSYWNDTVAEKDSHSVSSYKGIPNTNKKYSEDKKVNWHSTPFEKRLERALNHRSEDV